MFLFINGKILTEREAKISALDPGFLYGRGLFETLRSYQGRLFLLEEHLARLFSSARVLGIKIPISKTKLADACQEVLEANQLKNARVRLSVSGEGRKGFTVLIFARALKEKISQKPRRIKLLKCNFSLARNYLLAKHKSLSYFPYLFAYEQARKRGGDEALFLTEDGILLEGSRANLFLVKSGMLKTPSLDLPILPGITRAKVIELARGEGLEVKEGEFSEKELLDSEVAFLTNSIIELALVESYPGKVFRNRSAILLVQRLWNLYQEQALGG